MKNIMNQMLLTSILAVSLGAVGASASSVTFKQFAVPFRVPALDADIYKSWCNAFGNDPYNQPRCLDTDLFNPLWGIGQPTFLLSGSGTLSNVAGQPNYLNMIGDGTQFDRSPVDTSNNNTNNWHLLTADVSFVSTCIRVDQDNQGKKQAVIRGFFGAGTGGDVHALPPGVFIPGMLLVVQNANGDDFFAGSLGDLGTTCEVSDAITAVIDPAIVAASNLPPLPQGMSDNLFNLLSKTTSGNITIKK